MIKLSFAVIQHTSILDLTQTKQIPERKYQRSGFLRIVLAHNFLSMYMERFMDFNKSDRIDDNSISFITNQDTGLLELESRKKTIGSLWSLSTHSQWLQHLTTFIWPRKRTLKDVNDGLIILHIPEYFKIEVTLKGMVLEVTCKAFILKLEASMAWSVRSKPNQ